MPVTARNTEFDHIRTYFNYTNFVRKFHKMVHFKVSLKLMSVVKASLARGVYRGGGRFGSSLLPSRHREGE